MHRNLHEIFCLPCSLGACQESNKSNKPVHLGHAKRATSKSNSHELPNAQAYTLQGHSASTNSWTHMDVCGTVNCNTSMHIIIACTYPSWSCWACWWRRSWLMPFSQSFLMQVTRVANFLSVLCFLMHYDVTLHTLYTGAGTKLNNKLSLGCSGWDDVLHISKK